MCVECMFFCCVFVFVWEFKKNGGETQVIKMAVYLKYKGSDKLGRVYLHFFLFSLEVYPCLATFEKAVSVAVVWLVSLQLELLLDISSHSPIILLRCCCVFMCMCLCVYVHVFVCLSACFHVHVLIEQHPSLLSSHYRWFPRRHNLRPLLQKPRTYCGHSTRYSGRERGRRIVQLFQFVFIVICH